MPSTCGRRTWSKSCACSTLTGSKWVLFTQGRKGTYIAGTKLELVASCLPAGRQAGECPKDSFGDTTGWW